MSEIPEDRKQLIDALTSGYVFSDQDAEDMAELIEIGRLAVELARAAQGLDFDACSAKGEELGKASAAYLAKQESKP